MGLIGPETSLWLIITLLSLIGVANYIQFTAMGTVTLTELNDHQASSGTSLMSVTIQLSIGLAVSMAGALLVAFNPGEGVLAQPSIMDSFSMAFFSLGTLTIISTLLFLRLPRKVKKNKRILCQVRSRISSGALNGTSYWNMDAVEKVLFGFGLSDTVIEVSRVTLAGQVIALHDTPTHQGSLRCQAVYTASNVMV